MFRGDRLKELRTKKGYTHEELAEFLDISPSQIWRYESGKIDPGTNIVGRMAEVFRVSSDYLLGLTDDTSPHMRVDNLSERELAIIAAVRKGDTIGAIKEIIADE